MSTEMERLMVARAYVLLLGANELRGARDRHDNSVSYQVHMALSLDAGIDNVDICRR